MTKTPQANGQRNPTRATLIVFGFDEMTSREPPDFIVSQYRPVWQGRPGHGAKGLLR